MLSFLYQMTDMVTSKTYGRERARGWTVCREFINLHPPRDETVSGIAVSAKLRFPFAAEDVFQRKREKESACLCLHQPPYNPHHS